MCPETPIENGGFFEREGHAAHRSADTLCHNVAQLIMAVQEFQVDPRYWAKELIAKLPELGSTQPRGIELARLGEKVTEEDEVE